MAIRNRTTLVTYVNEVNAQGVATQDELNNAISTHLSDYHDNEPHSRWDNGIEYFYDSENDRWLSKQLFEMDFFDNDRSTSNIYLYVKKGIRCNYSYNSLPFNNNFLLDKIEVSLDRNKSGDLFDVEDSNGNKLYTITTPDQKYTILENVNTLITDGVRIYTNYHVVRRPIVKLWMRIIF